MRRITIQANDANPVYVPYAAWVRLGKSDVLHAAGEPGSDKTQCGEVMGDHRFLEPVEECSRTFCGMCVGMVTEKLDLKDAVSVLRGDTERMSKFIAAAGPKLAKELLALADAPPMAPDREGDRSVP